MKPKFSKLLIAVSLSALVLTGCSNSKFSEEKEDAFLDTFVDEATTDGVPSDLRKKLDQNIKKLSEKGASDAVDGLLYNLYQKASVLNTQASGLQATFAKLKEEKIDVTKSSDYAKVTDKVVKAFLDELSISGLKLMEDNGNYTVVTDMALILEKYEDLIADDLITMIKFSEMEYTKGYFNLETETFDMDTIRERILFLEKAKKDYPESYYLDGLKEAYDYYYQVYFGVLHQYFIDDKKKIKDDVLAHYEATVKGNPDSQFGKDTQKVIDMLKKTNNIVDDNLMVELLDLTNYKTESYTTQDGVNVTDVEGGTIIEGQYTSDEDLEKTINNFIESQKGADEKAPAPSDKAEDKK